MNNERGTRSGKINDMDRGLAEPVRRSAPRRGRRPPAQQVTDQPIGPPGYQFIGRLSAAHMLAAISRRQPSIARWFSVSGDRLLAAPIPPQGAPMWYPSVELGSRWGEWIVTSGTTRLGARGISRLVPDLPPRLQIRDPHGAVRPPTIPHVGREQFGVTLPSADRLASGGVPGRRGVVVVSVEVVAERGATGELPVQDEPRQVETFLHEVACHAGRISAGLPAQESHPEVQRIRSAIESMFPQLANLPAAPRARIPR